MQTRVSTLQPSAITRKRRSVKSTKTGGLVSGSGYGTICGTTTVMRPPRVLANVPASRNAASVASTEVNTTEISNLESVFSVNGCAGAPVTGAISLSSASAIGFRPLSYEGRCSRLKKSLERDKEIVKKTVGLSNLQYFNLGRGMRNRMPSRASQCPRVQSPKHDPEHIGDDKQTICPPHKRRHASRQRRSRPSERGMGLARRRARATKVP